MAEVVGNDGVWTFDGHWLRIVPGREKEVSRIRAARGGITVPLEAVASVAFEAAPEGGRQAEDNTGRLRLRLRTGADPFLVACVGWLADDSDPYRLKVRPERGGAADHFADEVRRALAMARVPAGPTDRYLVAAPPVPVTGNAMDGVGSFDGETVRLEWGRHVYQEKRLPRGRVWPLQALEAVEWRPAVGTDPGWVRFRLRGDAWIVSPNPRLDPNCLTLWDTRHAKKEDGSCAVFAAAVVGRMRHPNAEAVAPATAAATAADGDHDALLRRLRELGDLRRDGVLTDEEFAVAKRAVLKKM